MRSRRATAGYTLVEALASLTLLGLLSFMLVEGLQSARLHLARLDQTWQGKDIEAAQTLLRARIERSSPLTELETPVALIDFDGKPDQLNFVAPAVLSHGPDALYHYRLYVAPGGDLRLDASNDLLLDQTQPASRVVLLRNVTGLDLSYYGAVGSQPLPKPGWSDHWQQTSTLPQLVRVRIAFAPQDRRRWPTLLVHPAATIDSECVIDPNTGGCQGRT